MNPSLSGPGLELGAWSFVLALAPILALVVLMLGLGWGGSRAGPAGLAVAILLAWGRFGSGAALGGALARGVLTSLPVLYIILPALLLFHVAEAAGGIRNIG